MSRNERGGDVAVFFTGGTIGMHAQENGGVAPAHAIEELMAQVRPHLGGVGLRVVDWADVPSPHMTPELMWRLSRDVQAMLADPEVCGAVVLHGTDVMEETAYLCDLTVDSDKPLIFSGAMRSTDELGYDGLRNILYAVRACLECPRSAGTLLLMSDRVFAASEVTKTHSTAIDAFASPGLGPLGSVAAERLHLERLPVRGRVFRPATIEPNVDLVKLCPGMDARYVECSRAHGVAGLVVEGFGAGNVPPMVVDALEAMAGDGLPVVLTSRCVQGGVWPIYGYRGGAAGLQKRGLILGGSLPGQKARIKLMVALGESRDPVHIREAFEGARP